MMKRRLRNTWLKGWLSVIQLSSDTFIRKGRIIVVLSGCNYEWWIEWMEWTIFQRACSTDIYFDKLIGVSTHHSTFIICNKLLFGFNFIFIQRLYVCWVLCENSKYGVVFLIVGLHRWHWGHFLHKGFNFISFPQQFSFCPSIIVRKVGVILLSTYRWQGSFSNIITPTIMLFNVNWFSAVAGVWVWF